MYNNPETTSGAETVNSFSSNVPSLHPPTASASVSVSPSSSSPSDPSSGSASLMNDSSNGHIGLAQNNSSLTYNPSLLDLYNFHLPAGKPRRPSFSGTLSLGGMDIIASDSQSQQFFGPFANFGFLGGIDELMALPSALPDPSNLFIGDLAGPMAFSDYKSGLECCGLDFQSLHELATHYETVHVTIRPPLARMAAIPEESVDSARSTSLSAVTLSGSVSPDLEGLIRSASEFDHDGGDSSSTNRSLYPTVVGNLLNRKPSISSTSNQNDPMSITKNSGDAAADYRCSSGTPADSPLISHTSSVKAESEEPEDVIPASGVGVLQRRLSELSLRPPVFTLPSTMSGSTMFSNDIESSMMSLISEEQQLGVVDPIGDSEFSLVHKLEAMVGNPEGVNSGAEVDDILSDMVSMSRQGKRTRVPSVTTTASVKMFRSSEDRSNDMAQSDFSQALFEFAALTKRMGGSEVMFDLSKPEDDAEQPPNPASWTSDSSGLNFPFVANSHSLPFHENIGGISSFADNQLDLPGTFPSVLAPAPAKFLPAFPSVSQVSVRPDSTVYSSITPAALSSPFAKSSATPPASENPPLVFHVYRQQTQVSGKTLKSSLVEPMSGALDRNKAPEPPFRSLTPQPHEVILQPSPVRLSDQNSSRQKRQNLRRHIATPNRPSSTPVFGTESTRPGSPLTRPSSPVTNGSLGTASAMAMPAAVLPGMPTIPTGVVEKKPYFKCPKPYCSKIYKNANGLRYHLERGNCEIESDADGDIIAVVKAAAAVRMSSLSASTSSSLDPKQESKVDDDDVVGDGSSPMLFSQPGDAEVPSVPHDLKIAHRPYWCRVSGCGRKYKNLNGLKYHGRVAHPEMSFREEVKGHASVRL